MTPEERAEKAYEDWREGETVGHPAQAYRIDDIPKVIAVHIRDAEADVRKQLAPGWRDMDTAPKDGTRVLLTDGKFVGTGAWREEYIGVTGEDEWIWSIDGERGDECPWANDYMGEPKGWQPLPDPSCE